MNQHGCRDVRCRPAIPTVHVIVHDRSNRRRINAKVNGLDFSTVGVLYFLMYIALENVSEKKKFHYHLKNVFIISLSPSTFDWFTGYFLPVSDWSQTSKQTKTDTGYLSMFYLLWFWGNQSLHLVFSSKFLLYLSGKHMSLAHEQLYFNDPRYHNYRTFSYNRNELS